MTEHCSNYDGSYEGCSDCPGKIIIVRSNGAVEDLCRAGEQFIRALIASSEVPTADNDVPVFKIQFPGPEYPKSA